MRRYAANYIISGTGVFLKNGIVVVNDDNFVSEYIDTKGHLRESEQLIFQNGIIIAGVQFNEISSANPVFISDLSFRSIVFQDVATTDRFTIQNLIDLGKRLQELFPEMRIPEILSQIALILQAECGYTRQQIPGIYLLVGTDLVELHFTSRSKLKEIL